MATPENTCYWRWRFQPVLAGFGHLGIDYTFEDPRDPLQPFFLRHVDYGLPGNSAAPHYRQCLALHNLVVRVNGVGWPPLRVPRGWIFTASPFVAAPRSVGDHFRTQLPPFYGRCGAYRLLGPNSNTALRRALTDCTRATGYRFARPPLRFRLGAWGWNWPGNLPPNHGPCPGYPGSPAAAVNEPLLYELSLAPHRRP